MNTFETLNEVAMKIILYAGNARTLINESFSYIEIDDIDKAKSKLLEAQKEIVKAHKSQTETIQTNVQDANFQSTLLFTHAQDTLMTVYSELNITKKLVILYEKINERIQRIQ